MHLRQFSENKVGMRYTSREHRHIWNNWKPRNLRSRDEDGAKKPSTMSRAHRRKLLSIVLSHRLWNARVSFGSLQFFRKIKVQRKWGWFLKFPDSLTASSSPGTSFKTLLSKDILEECNGSPCCQTFSDGRGLILAGRAPRARRIAAPSWLRVNPFLSTVSQMSSATTFALSIRGNKSINPHIAFADGSLSHGFVDARPKSCWIIVEMLSIEVVGRKRIPDCMSALKPNSFPK